MGSAAEGADRADRLNGLSATGRPARSDLTSSASVPGQIPYFGSPGSVALICERSIRLTVGESGAFESFALWRPRGGSNRPRGMRLTGPNLWGDFPDRRVAIDPLRESVEAGVALIDTADVYGPHTNELLVRDALPSLPGTARRCHQRAMTRSPSLPM